MKAFISFVALFVVGALAQNFSINTPASVVECQPTLLSWVGGSPPYIPSIHNGNDPNGNPIETLSQTSSTSLTWTCNIATGTYIGFSLRDNTGAVVQSAAISVQAGSSSSCLSGGSSITASSASGSPTSTSTTPASSGTETGTTPASSATPSSTSASSGASANIAQFGAAGIVGAALVALFL